MRGLFPRMTRLAAIILLTIRGTTHAKTRFADTGNPLLWTTGRHAENGFVTHSSLEFLPAKRCTPTQIKLRFRCDFNITTGDRIVVGLAGFTSGECDNVEGKSITSVFNEIKYVNTLVPGYLKLEPNSHFIGGYKEGLVTTGYEDSKLLFTVSPGVTYTNGTEIVINVDQVPPMPRRSCRLV